MADWESQKKALLPYLQRAAEIEAVDPKVAYYCRLYAVEQGIKIEQRDNRVDDLLELVLNQLEKDKPHLVLETATDLDHCEKFALNVYIKAKRRDEQGVSDRDTAKAYYAAFNFIEILKQFGPLSPEVEKERRFAVFRAAEIKRCLDEGNEPPPLAASKEAEMPESETGGGSHRRVESLPLIDYDPGYLLGSKVLVMDEESGLVRKGIVRSKATEVGGFFNIHSDDGTQRQLGALFLAPDLSEGGDVTYFFPDGRQMNAVVTQMQFAEWPPVYTLKLEDESTRSVTHSQFVLNSEPVTSEVPEPEHREELAPVASLQSEGSFSAEYQAERPALRKQESWIKWKDPSKKNEFAQLPSQPPPAEPPSIPAPPPTQVLPTVTDTTPLYPGTAKPLTPEDYYRDDFEGEVAAASPSVQVVNYDVIARRPAVAPWEEPVQQNIADFKPEPAAVKQATKFTHQATAALNFSDVHHAIQCLQSALNCLTQPSE